MLQCNAYLIENFVTRVSKLAYQTFIYTVKFRTFYSCIFFETLSMLLTTVSFSCRERHKRQAVNETASLRVYYHRYFLPAQVKASAESASNFKYVLNHKKRIVRVSSIFFLWCIHVCATCIHLALWNNIIFYQLTGRMYFITNIFVIYVCNVIHIHIHR